MSERLLHVSFLLVQFAGMIALGLMLVNYDSEDSDSVTNLIASSSSDTH